jgi:hypothetical protein
VRPRLALVAAVLAVLVALVLPAVSATPPPASYSGPPTVASVWPQASIGEIPGVLPDGSSYEPLAVGAGVSVGQETSTGAQGGQTTSLTVVTSGGTRRLREFPADGSTRLAAVMIGGSQAFWLESSPLATVGPPTTLWAADLPGGAPHLLASDPSSVLTVDPPYDLVLANGHLHWLAFRTDGGEVHSVPVTGGQVSAQVLPWVYSIIGWPWLATPMPGDHGPKHLLNVETGEQIDIDAPYTRELACVPGWCRVSTYDGMNIVEVGTMHTDGSHYQVLSQFGRYYTVNDQPMLIGRFEVEGQPAASPTPSGTSTADTSNTVIDTGTPVPDTLWLVDVANGRRVQLTTDFAQGFHSDDNGHIWWSTGTGNAPMWHTLDLRSLT